MESRNVATKTPLPPIPMNRVLKVNRRTPAAQWNRRILKTLSIALEKDPETDLLSIVPNVYSQTLAVLREDSGSCPSLKKSQVTNLLLLLQNPSRRRRFTSQTSLDATLDRSSKSRTPPSSSHLSRMMLRSFLPMTIISRAPL